MIFFNQVSLTYKEMKLYHYARLIYTMQGDLL